MNPKIIVGGVVAAFAIIVAIIGFAGSSFIDDVSGKGFLSPTDTPRQALPLEIDLEKITILEVDDTSATIEIEFEVNNPNFKAVILQFIKYELYENNVRIHVGQIGDRAAGMVDGSNYFTILSENPTILRDKITIKNSGNHPEFWDSLLTDTPNWRIKGEAFFNLSSITAGGENEISFEFP